MNATIVRGTARRLGITRPLPTRTLTRAEREQQQSQSLSQVLASAAMFIRRPDVVTEDPVPMTVDGEFLRQTCTSCGYWTEHHAWLVTPPARQHYCRRDDVTMLVVWPGRG